MVSFNRRLLISIIGVALILTSGIQMVTAQDAGTPVPAEAPQIIFGVYPEGGMEGQFFEAVLEPGASKEFSLALRNAGTKRLSLVAYPADIYSMTNGGMGVSFQDQERAEPTTWVDFPEGTVEIEPGEELLQSFTVTVPEGTTPGQYVTALGVETADSYAVGEEGGAFRQVLRKVIAIAIVVPGPVEPAFALGAPEVMHADGFTVLRIPVENTGNIRVRPTGTVTLRDAEGQQVAAGEVEMGSVYAGDTAPYELWMSVPLPVGEYQVSADLTDPDTGAAASIDNAAVTLVPAATPVPNATPVGPPVATPVPEAGPVIVRAVEIAANADPIQFVNVAFEIENTGNHISRTRITLAVSHNGEVVEEFEIDDNLPLPVGTTSVEDRYIPPTGWESGTWTFSITVHSINSNEDVETVIVSEEEVATIEVP